MYFALKTETAVVLLLITAHIANGFIEGSVRLVTRKRPVGSLEIFHDSVWGPICPGNNSWSLQNAVISCQMLGYKRGYPLAIFNVKDKTAVLQGVSCTGNEKNLAECENEGWGSYNCQFLAGVLCTGIFSGNACSGRVCEDYHNACCRDEASFTCCWRSTTTTATSTTTEWNADGRTATECGKDRTGPSHSGTSFRWWWVTFLIIAVVICLLAWLRIANFCRGNSSSRRVGTLRRAIRSDARHSQSRQLSNDGLNRPIALPVDLPPPYSEIAKYGYPAQGKANVNRDRQEQPPPPYSSTDV